MTARFYAYLELEGRDVLVGTAFVNRRRQQLSTTFEYADSYRARPRAYGLDPGLPLYAGGHHTPGLPGCFADASPDRWGRNLIAKQLRASSPRSAGEASAPTDVDYLLGVSDLTRQGALRFRRVADGAFSAEHKEVPKLIELPRLLAAARNVTRDEDDLTDVTLLLDAGSASLGGARPKASVRDGDRLMIAKFPHDADDWDVMAWEKTALDLALRCGIRVPTTRIERLSAGSVLLLDRFDRVGSDRVGYLSAMTLLQAADGEPRDYVEIAEVFGEHAERPVPDLHQLWRRAAFFVAVNNTDDHLRNHGFLRGRSGWVVAPAFDVNPNPAATQPRVTGMDGGYTRRECLEGLRRSSTIFGLSREAAELVLIEVARGLESWRAVATGNGITPSETDRFAQVFEGFGRLVTGST